MGKFISSLLCFSNEQPKKPVQQPVRQVVQPPKPVVAPKPVEQVAVESPKEDKEQVQTYTESASEGSEMQQVVETGTVEEAEEANLTEPEYAEIIEEHMESEPEELDLVALQPGQAHASTGSLLEAQEPRFQGKKCLVLDLDETLVHSSFKYLKTADFVIPVEIDDQTHNVYVIKRPGVDEFMRRVGELFEVVVFTASVSRYGDPLLDVLDVHKAVHHRLFRDSCFNYQGNYIKNLSQIGRPLGDTIILDNSPASYIFHPQHAIPISSWFSDTHDNELLDILPLLEDLAQQHVNDVGLVLDVTI